jgi:hypothetical protein
MKKPIYMYMCYQIHLPNVVLAYVTQRTKILVKKQLKLPGSNYYTKLSYTAVQSIQVAVVLEHH